MAVNCTLEVSLEELEYQKQELSLTFLAIMQSLELAMQCTIVQSFEFANNSSFGIVAKWRIYAVWSGLLIGLIFIDVCYSILIVRINWEQESINAMSRSEQGNSACCIANIVDVEVEQLVNKTEDEVLQDKDLEQSQEMFTIEDEEEHSTLVHKLS